MGKKTKLPLFSKNNNGEKPKPSSSWQWPSCHQPRTHSFRTDETPESSWFLNSSESPSFSTASDESATESTAVLDSVETVIQGLRVRSERLFFEPSEAKLTTDVTEPSPFKATTVLSMDSLNPLVDFRESMEEMVEAHGLKDWEKLEELLGWYLKANCKSSHGYILGAFVDLLLKKVGVSSSSPCSPLSFYTSSLSSSSEDTSTSATPCECSLKSDDNNSNVICSSSLSEEEIIKDIGVSSCSS
ncbi:ovate family protein 13, ARABIDOPSIS THALIANA OVATE FAMILY PROTEIN 13 [Hibiscus trionum]|uniref:Transcription repressor n=1 Tax=Hibiscus trionum TaxID=183268 RepID=A0A9W7GV25_HIBTR|nr:ovate family protein 13, ARABIDOPSIS THALIANA OVATE FAMILY PROTEIN 13 [Hibiscus trionum]